MRTYWATCYKGETVPPPMYLDNGLRVIPLFAQKHDGEVADDAHQLEVAVVPAAALKRLVEAVEKAYSELDQALEHDYFIMSEEAYFALQSALSEWKGGAE